MGREQLRDVSEKLTYAASRLQAIREEMARTLVGQGELVSRLLIGLIADGHILVEGVPGLAKTLSIHTLAQVVGLDFARIQFTPDLLPADLVGTEVYHAEQHEFVTRKGPVFANLVLADEINRAPAKVQSGLLEAMQERQVTIGGVSYPLPRPFLVMATQNPLELEGTYPLPEAQVDRFMMKVNIYHPSRSEESEILARMGNPGITPDVQKVADVADVLEFRDLLSSIYIDERLVAYILDIVFATRVSVTDLSEHQNPESFTRFGALIECGASPRATLCLGLAAKGMALLEGRAFVTPEDIKAVASDVLAHRILPSYEAEAENLSGRIIVDELLKILSIP